MPFSGLFELLRPALGLLERLAPPQAGALESALALRPAAGGERFAIGAATLSLLAAYSDEAPALILVDDAHLLDPSSAEALLFALRRLLAEPLAAVLAVRKASGRCWTTPMCRHCTSKDSTIRRRVAPSRDGAT